MHAIELMKEDAGQVYEHFKQLDEHLTFNYDAGVLISRQYKKFSNVLRLIGGSLFQVQLSLNYFAYLAYSPLPYF